MRVGLTSPILTCRMHYEELCGLKGWRKRLAYRRLPPWLAFKILRKTYHWRIAIWTWNDSLNLREYNNGIPAIGKNHLLLIKPKIRSLLGKLPPSQTSWCCTNIVAVFSSLYNSLEEGWRWCLLLFLCIILLSLLLSLSLFPVSLSGFGVGVSVLG